MEGNGKEGFVLLFRWSVVLVLDYLKKKKKLNSTVKQTISEISTNFQDFLSIKSEEQFKLMLFFLF